MNGYIGSAAAVINTPEVANINARFAELAHALDALAQHVSDAEQKFMPVCVPLPPANKSPSPVGAVGPARSTVSEYLAGACAQLYSMSDRLSVLTNSAEL